MYLRTLAGKLTLLKTKDDSGQAWQMALKVRRYCTFAPSNNDTGI